MKIPFSPPDITEEEIAEVVGTLKSGWITTGPKTKLFEKNIANYCNTNKAVCLNSATACMELTLRLLGIGKGDEVITSAYTYSASASVICHVGATPVIVDTDRDKFHISLNEVEKSITKNTKAIIPIDIAGVPCNYLGLQQVLDSKKNLFTPNNKIAEKIGRVTILDDAAHSFGAKYRNCMVGSIADFTSFSFHAVKNLTTSEGGAVTWHEKLKEFDEEIYRSYMLYSLHGQNKDALAKNKIGAWEYDIIAPYYKCNMTDIMASIGIIQLRRYNDLLATRNKIIKVYDDILNDEKIKTLKHYTEEYQSSGHLYLTRIAGYNADNRNNIIEKMAEKGIATNVHYKPLPMMTAYKNMGFNIETYPNAYSMYENEITLPLFSLMTEEQAEYVAKTLKDIIKTNV